MHYKILARCTGFNVNTDGKRITSLPLGTRYRWHPAESTTLRRFFRCWVALGYLLEHEIEGRRRPIFSWDFRGTWFDGGPFTVGLYRLFQLADRPIGIGCKHFTIKQADTLWRNLAPYYDYEVED